jgi:hypothetical protein
MKRRNEEGGILRTGLTAVDSHVHATGHRADKPYE